MDNYLGLREELCISIITLTSLDKQMEDPKAGGVTLGIIRLHESICCLCSEAALELLSY